MFVIVYVFLCTLIRIWDWSTIGFINLVTRKDRLALTRREMTRMGIDGSKIEGQVAHNSAMGCSKSHLLALQSGFLTIYEDDICFNVEPEKFHKQQSIWNYIHYDVVMIASRIVDYELTILKHIVRITQGYTSAGYMVHPGYVATLISNIKQGIKTNIPIDVHWHSLQSSGKWFGYASVMAYQRDGYSDIEKRFTRYNDKAGLKTEFHLHELVLSYHSMPNAMQVIYCDLCFLDLIGWRMFVRNKTQLKTQIKLILNHNGWKSVRWQ